MTPTWSWADVDWSAPPPAKATPKPRGRPRKPPTGSAPDLPTAPPKRRGRPPKSAARPIVRASAPRPQPAPIQPFPTTAAEPAGCAVQAVAVKSLRCRVTRRRILNYDNSRQAFGKSRASAVRVAQHRRARMLSGGAFRSALGRRDYWGLETARAVAAGLSNRVRERVEARPCTAAPS